MTYRKPFRKPDHRAQLRLNNAADRFYAAMSPNDVAPQSQADVAPKREVAPRARRTGPTPEGATNIEIRGAFKNHPTVALFRNNRGLAYYSSGAPVAYGVGPDGAADWLGWTSIRITPDMIGKRIAVFTSVEAKAPGQGAEEDQTKWLERVKRAGGIAGVAHSGIEAVQIIEGSKSWEPQSSKL